MKPHAREISASPTWIAAPAMNADHCTDIKLDTEYVHALYRKS